MSKVAFSPDTLAPPVGPFSPAVKANDFTFLSGQVGMDPSTKKIVEGGVESQTVQCFKNLQSVLEVSGKSFADAVRVGVYLTSMNDFAAMNAVYATYFSKPFPARTTIAVAALPLGACVEIDMVVA